MKVRAQKSGREHPMQFPKIGPCGLQIRQIWEKKHFYRVYMENERHLPGFAAESAMRIV